MQKVSWGTLVQETCGKSGRGFRVQSWEEDKKEIQEWVLWGGKAGIKKLALSCSKEVHRREGPGVDPEIWGEYRQDLHPGGEIEKSVEGMKSLLKNEEG